MAEEEKSSPFSISWEAKMMTRVGLCPIQAPRFHNSPSDTFDTGMPGIFVSVETSFGVCRDVSGRIWESSGMRALLKKKKYTGGSLGI